MAVQMLETSGGRVLEIVLTGRLTTEDYEFFVPHVERLIERHGKLRVLVDMRDFHGWDAGALWKDVKFDLKHFSDIDRLALVGDKKWEKGMAVFCKPFTTAEVRYYERERVEEAREWVREGVPADAT